MSLPTSGSISISQINVELKVSNTRPSNLGASDLRGLAGVSSGAISLSQFRGKSSGPPPLSASGFGVTGTGHSYDSLPSWTNAGVFAYNGVSPYSYQWGFVNANGAVFPANTSLTNDNVTVSRNPSPPGHYESILRCVVRDAAGAVAVADNIVVAWDYS